MKASVFIATSKGGPKVGTRRSLKLQKRSVVAGFPGSEEAYI
jgi:hypothetical protein